MKLLGLSLLALVGCANAPTAVEAMAAAPLVAQFTVACQKYTCTFDAHASTGAITQYEWYFGDATPVVYTSGPTTSHRYSRKVSATVTAVLVVHDVAGGASPYTMVTFSPAGM